MRSVKFSADFSIVHGEGSEQMAKHAWKYNGIIRFTTILPRDIPEPRKLSGWFNRNKLVNNGENMGF